MHSLRLLPVLVLGTAAIAASTSAPSTPPATLLMENFDELPLGAVAHGDHAAIVPWEGPAEREYGYVSVLPAPGGGSTAKAHGKTIAIHDNTSLADKSPSLQFHWSPAPSVSLAWDVVVVNDEPFLGVHFVGNDWNDSAVIVIFAGGTIYVQHAGGDGDRAVIGTYLPGQWRSIRLDLNGTTKTFDAFLDGKKVLSGYDWQRTAAPTLDRLGVVADYSTTDHQGQAVIHIDNLRVTALPAAPTTPKSK